MKTIASPQKAARKHTARYLSAVLSFIIAVLPLGSFAADTVKERRQAYLLECSESLESTGRNKRDSGDICNCLAKAITQTLTEEEYRTFRMGDYSRVLGAADKEAEQLAKCGELAKQTGVENTAALKASQTYSSAVCTTFGATLTYSCKRTITGGHAWCFMHNNWGWDDGDILCTGAPADSSCTSDTVQFGIIPTLLPPTCEFSK
ncbi:hypothetical protein GCM10008090_33110 [Arenicella chitinivorans]|uniref:Uncharacterized protein n=1 Tax=Arenicella chitinivorans TaxID=1329800 RepID=A0A918VSG2_9GAMM|nr:hypothetical protein [Arenicella chitinivorans]GHA20585.1 hypothetical protein GCM10008090_33110 [Arenicella chitinivorans]